MDYSDIIPAVIILVANILSGKHGGRSYENITALFGLSFFISCVLYTISFKEQFVLLKPYEDILLKIAAFSLITVLSRDYEKILKPFIDYFRRN